MRALNTIFLAISFSILGAFWFWTFQYLDRQRIARKVKAAATPHPLIQHPCARFHFHVPIEISTIRGAYPYACTALLSRCQICGDHKSELYLGDFQLADFLRKENAVAELERLANK